MSFDYHVAVHRADWPTVATLNQYVAELGYPLSISGISSEEFAGPLRGMPRTLGLKVTLEGRPVELEASITQLSKTSPYAFGLSPDLPTTNVTGSTGSAGKLTQIIGIDSFVPKDLNTDLRALGVKSPDYKDGDCVLTLSFRSSVVEYRAGAFLMAGLIKCANGLGFEFQQGRFGTDDWAESLVRETEDLSIQK